jgi:non-ribosomal peptide synthetase component E (peptide arylation enzyme)
LLAELSPWKIPSRIHVVATLPLTPTGKIDKQDLKRMHARAEAERRAAT